MSRNKAALSRRNFLKSAGISAAGLGLGSLPFHLNSVSAQDTTIILTSWWGPPSPWGTVLQERIVTSFNEANPDISLDSQVIAFADILTLLQTQIAAGDPPDLTMIQPQNFTPLYSRGVFANLDSFVEASTSFDLNDIYPSALERVTKNGSLYGVPTDVNVFLLYYNKQLFEDAGVDLPHEDWTWEDMLEAGIALTSGRGPEKIYGLVLPPYEIVVRAAGGDILNEDETEVVLTEEAAINGLQWMVDVVNEYGISPDLTGSSFGGVDASVPDLFRTGKLAMFIDGSHNVGRFSDLEFPWDVAAIPTWQQRSTIVQGASFAIFDSKPNQEAAWRFIEHFASPAMQTLMGEEGGLVPILRSAVSSFTDQPGRPENIAVLPASLEFARPRPFVANYSQMINIIDSELEAAIWLQNKTVEEAAQAIKEQVDPLLSE